MAAMSSINSIEVDQGSKHVVMTYLTPSLLVVSSFILIEKKYHKNQIKSTTEARMRVRMILTKRPFRIIVINTFENYSL